MTQECVPPGECRSMAEVREGVDGLDREIVALLALRFRYMDAAARIKPMREMVRDEERKAQVLANVAAAAAAAGAPGSVVADVWETLVEGSIAYELERFDALRVPGSASAAAE
jgi:isochorismate pyruvate lyase